MIAGFILEFILLLVSLGLITASAAEKSWNMAMIALTVPTDHFTAGFTAIKYRVGKCTVELQSIFGRWVSAESCRCRHEL